MAKLLIDIDNDLMAAAQDVLGQPNKTATIREALRRAVAQRVPDPLLDYALGLDDEQREVLMQARDRW